MRSKAQKTSLVGMALLIAAFTGYSQNKETFDLASYELPAGFSTQQKNGYVLHEKVDQTTGSWCQLMLFKSIASTGSLENDFKHEWSALIEKNYQGTQPPNIQTVEENGWTAQAGATSFDYQGQTCYALLTAISGFGQLMSVVVTMNNRHFEADIDQFLESVLLTKPARQVLAAVPAPISTSATSHAGYGITKATTNFTDGWMATLASDKVVVTKGPVRVYLYFPLAYNDQSRAAGRDFYWDRVLPQHFRITSKRYRDHGEVMTSFQAPYIEGTGVELVTGTACFLALFVTSANGMMIPVLALAPDEDAIRKAFPKAESQMDSDLAAMTYYNRFAVSLSDVIGKWKGGDFTAANYYNVYSGAYAGMGAVAMSERFDFFANGDYTSKHQGASGMVGSMSTYSQEYKGKATISDWSMVMTNRFEGKATTFNAWFEAVPGGRILHLQDAQYSGLRFDLAQER